MYNNIIIFIVLILLLILILFIYYNNNDNSNNIFINDTDKDMKLSSSNNLNRDVSSIANIKKDIIYNINHTCNYIFINDTDKDMTLSVFLDNNLNIHHISSDDFKYNIISSVLSGKNLNTYNLSIINSKTVNSKKYTIISLNKNQYYNISLTKINDILSLENHFDIYKVINDKILYFNNNGKIELNYDVKNNDIVNNLKELKIINKTDDFHIIEIRVSTDIVMYIRINKNSEMLINNHIILSTIYKNYLNKLVTIKLYNSKNVTVIDDYKFDINNINNINNIEIYDDNIIN